MARGRSRGSPGAFLGGRVLAIGRGWALAGLGERERVSCKEKSDKSSEGGCERAGERAEREEPPPPGRRARSALVCVPEWPRPIRSALRPTKWGDSEAEDRGPRGRRRGLQVLAGQRTDSAHAPLGLPWGRSAATRWPWTPGAQPVDVLLPVAREPPPEQECPGRAIPGRTRRSGHLCCCCCCCSWELAGSLPKVRDFGDPHATWGAGRFCIVMDPTHPMHAYCNLRLLSYFWQRMSVRVRNVADWIRGRGVMGCIWGWVMGCCCNPFLPR